MNKKLLAGLTTGLILLGMAGMAQALSLTDVGGNIDTLKYQTKLAHGSGDADELAWINSVLGGSHTFVLKDENLTGEWQPIDGMAGVFAHTLVSDPAYFLIKTGNVTVNDDSRQFLFENLAGLDWAVIDLEAMGFDSITNISGVSHISEYDAGTPIPEPATMLLLGTGLTGLASIRRKKKA